MTEREKAVYMISVVAEMLGLHPQTLRLYEREGFVCPKRTEGGVRLYSADDVERLRTVITLTRDLGVNLAGVEVILTMREKMEKLQEDMERAAEEMRREFMAELARREELMKNPLVKVPPKGRVIKIKVEKG
ncbi:MAG: helix-turn-helix transcriptional regulator [Nitrospirae bacterium]|nr:helix-turn-helix transcriptional regulator [Nitrospirota bacterium]